MPRHKRLKYNNYLAISAACALLFVITAVLAARGTMTANETGIFNWIYGWNIDMVPLFWAITQVGSVWLALSGIVVFWVYGKQRLAIKLLAGGAATYALVWIAKELVDRPRPYLLESGITQRENITTGSGFPSGHTALITLFCVIVQPYLPKRYRWLIWLVIPAVGLSRVYLGVHAPLDVLGGFALGAFVGYSIRFFDPKS